MRRNRKHTSFCMGQCVSSCGSKRTLDSVPTTPDTENYPGLISSSSRAVTCSQCSNYQFDNQPCKHQLLALTSAGAVGVGRTRSPAAKFVANFSQKKIVARRINPGGESPVHITRHITPPPDLPLHITTLLTPTPVFSQDGDMKGTPVKNYFRETISSAKKSSASKTVTFSSEVDPQPPLSTSTKKKHFFSFSTTLTGKSSSKNKEYLEKETGDQTVAPHSSSKKGFLRKKSKSGAESIPVITGKPIKDKFVSRITLSPKQSSSRSGLQSSSSSSFGSLNKRESKSTNGVDENDQSEGKAKDNQQTMGNASTSIRGNDAVDEVVKTSKYSIVKSTSVTGIREGRRGDINENTSPTNNPHIHGHTLSSSQSVESPGLIRKNETATKSVTLDSNVLRNLNSIKEENRLLRLKFFLEESENNIPAPSTFGQENIFKEDIPNSNNTMNRQNFLSNRGSAIPLPKPGLSKSQINLASSSVIPKLYSVVPTTGDQQRDQTDQGQGSKGRFKPVASKSSSAVQQPSNLNSGWVAAAEFFEPQTETTPPTSTASTSSAKGSRRTSEPPRWPPAAVRYTKAHPGPSEVNNERRGTLGYQPRKLPMTNRAGYGGAAPKPVKAAITTSTTTTTEKSIPAFKYAPASRFVKKPEQTKPLYEIGLYQNRPRTAPEATRPTGVLQTGFHGVSTGIVKQRAQQYQSKVSESPSAPKISRTVSPKVATGNTTSKPSTSSEAQDDSPSKRAGVQRSATYTIRKHAAAGNKDGVPAGFSAVSQERTKSDVDPRYLTWTKKGGHRGVGHMTRSLNVPENEKCQMKENSFMSEASGITSVGYPLQHNLSTTSTSSVGTNEDGIGDHAVISDSEYLIDDEISDQPDLTLTFKDSSMKLSPSTSGESLLSSDIMLDHLDHNTNRLLGELTSDSAISDISTHKQIPHSIAAAALSKLSNAKSSTSASAILDPSSRIQEFRSKASPSESPSPTHSSTRAVRHPKSPRRISKFSNSASSSPASKSVRQVSGSGDTGIPRLSSSNSNSHLATTPKQQRSTQETPKQGSTGKPNHVRSLLGSPPSLSPVNQIKSAIAKKSTQVVGLTIENITKHHKQYELEEKVSAEASPATTGEDYAQVSSSEVPCMSDVELQGEFQDLRDTLESLRTQLEIQERREREKDELISRLNGEVDRLKSLVGKGCQQNGTLIEKTDEEEKERYVKNCIYENAAVQTENNNIFNKAVTYPEDDDKYGELVSFRIGRSSSVKKKL